MQAYNVILLIDFCCTALENLYKEKCRNFANFRNRSAYIFFRNNLKKVSYLSADDIVQLTENLFIVPSEKNKDDTYTVDIQIGCCSCSDGRWSNTYI